MINCLTDIVEANKKNILQKDKFKLLRLFLRTENLENNCDKFSNASYSFRKALFPRAVYKGPRFKQVKEIDRSAGKITSLCLQLPDYPLSLYETFVFKVNLLQEIAKLEELKKEIDIKKKIKGIRYFIL